MVAGFHPFNAALALTTGDLITYLDDDDEYLPNRLETLVEFYRSTNCDLAWHPFWHEMSDGSWKRYRLCWSPAIGVGHAECCMLAPTADGVRSRCSDISRSVASGRG